MEVPYKYNGEQFQIRSGEECVLEILWSVEPTWKGVVYAAPRAIYTAPEMLKVGARFIGDNWSPDTPNKEYLSNLEQRVNAPEGLTREVKNILRWHRYGQTVDEAVRNTCNFMMAIHANMQQDKLRQEREHSYDHEELCSQLTGWLDDQFSKS